VLLHSAFAGFAVIAALATIYAVQIYTEGIANRLEAVINEAQLVEGLQVDLKSLDAHLHELVIGRRPADPEFDRQSDAVLTRLDEAVRYAGQDLPESAEIVAAVNNLREALATAIDECIRLVRSGDQPAAARIFKDRIETDIIDALDLRLRHLRSLLDARRSDTSGLLFARNTQLLAVSLVVAASGVGLVVAGAIVVRRRLIAPIARLKAATEAFAAGDLAHRVQTDSTDELGVLGTSLNTMASSLRASQRKFKSLFENQRDAVIVCDRSGTIREHHDGDSKVLAESAQPIVGSNIAGLWPGGEDAAHFWTELVERVFASRETIRVTECSVPTHSGGIRVLDVVAYLVDYADELYAALVLRDVAERVSLQKELRRSETMTAAMTVARGIAHDFKNLLHSAVNTLALICDDTTDQQIHERAESALAACRQAVSLSRRLSRFAGTEPGNPEVLALMETVRLMLSALDDSFREGIDIRLSGDEDAVVAIDRDHLTQIVLNLLINAREAMPNGGGLEVAACRVRACDPRVSTAPRQYAALTIRDSGCGISPEALDRVFQPFYSSKERGSHGPRGLGLAVVYALVNQAGGFIRVESKLNQGSAFHVHFPLPGEAGAGISMA